MVGAVGRSGVRPLVTLILLLGACAPEGTTVTVASTSGIPSTSTPAASTPAAPGGPSTAPALLRGLAYETVVAAPFPNVVAVRDGETWVGTKDGRIWRLGPGTLELLADLSGRVRDEGERGLLGMAVHPDDPDRLFVHYSAAADGDTVLAELAVVGGVPDPGTERVVLRLDQPAANHNGGSLLFGPDGMLYLALGDGGGAGDRYGNGQNVDTLLGGIVRLDVGGGAPYAVPPDNPFVGGDGADELWAYGLRNPWRIAFDDGWLYVADVGQDAYEEVDVVDASVGGLNFGWPLTEGLHCYTRGCDPAGTVVPVVEVAHGDGGACSITGGVVYRGAAIPELAGHYLYSDYCGGWLRSFRWDGAAAVDHRDWTGDVGVPGQVVSFGTDAAGEVLVLTPGAVLRIVPVR